MHPLRDARAKGARVSIAGGIFLAGIAVVAFIAYPRSRASSTPSPPPNAVPIATTLEARDAKPATLPPTVDDDVRAAATTLAEDDYIHHAFVAVGPDDVTVWKDGDGTFHGPAGSPICEKCLSGDFVIARDRVAWLEVLDLDVAGFDSSVRALSVAGWSRPDGGSVLTAGERAVSLRGGGAVATDGTFVYAVEGKDDDAGDGHWQTIDRIDLHAHTKTFLAKTESGIRIFVHAAGELFVVWAKEVHSTWQVQAVSTKSGAVRDVLTLTPGNLPDMVASNSRLYFSRRDRFERTSPTHLAFVSMGGGIPTPLYDTGPNEIIGALAADHTGLYVVRYDPIATGPKWKLTRFADAEAAPPQDLAQFDEMPRAIAARRDDVAVAFLHELKLVPKKP